MLRALYVGRFQPLHIGHGKAIEHIMRKTDELIIVIGSAQKSHNLDNPFTTGERIMMMNCALKEMQIDQSKCYIIPVPDALMQSVWVSTVISYTPPFEVVYSNEPLTSRLFREYGMKVENIPFFRREVYSSTEVRRRMLAKENWKELVPKSVVDIVEEINGVERLIELDLADTLPKKNLSFKFPL